jgi:phage tail tape-measure protein
MPLVCPKCQSSNIDKKNYAKKTGAATGLLAGAFGAFEGAEAGAAIGLLGGPAGVVAGGIAGVIAGGLAGLFLGGKVGAAVDEHVLNNYKCLDCEHSFSD